MIVTNHPYLTEWRLELCRMVREHCYQTDSALPESELALEVPVEVMAQWFVRSDTVLGNIRLAMTMVQQNYEAAEAHGRATGARECTYDGVTWRRDTAVPV